MCLKAFSDQPFFSVLNMHVWTENVTVAQLGETCMFTCVLCEGATGILKYVVRFNTEYYRPLDIKTSKYVEICCTEYWT